MKPFTEEDLIPLRDTFLNTEGKVLANDIDDQTVFPIAAGPWPSEFPDAIRVQCAACDDFAAISPKGWELHHRNPARFIFCSPCFVGLYNLMLSEKGLIDGE